MAGPDRLVVWSPEARTDLSDIWAYYAQVAGPLTADSIIRKIADASRLLEDQPYGGRLRAELRPGLRSVGAKPYVIFYRIGARDIAEIVRVIDGRRDLDQIFVDEHRNK